MLEEGLDGRRAARRGRGDRGGGRRRRACEIVAGDTKVVERGHADGMYICTTGVGRARPARAAVPRRAAPGRPRSSSPGRSASTARRSCSRAASSSLDADDRVRHAARCGRRSTRCSTPPGRRCAACATRRAAASRRCSTSWRAPRAWRCSCARPTCRCTRRSPGAAELLGIDPMYVANEGSARRVRRPGRAPDAALAALRGVRRAASRRAEIGEVKTEPPGMVLVETALRRQAGDGSARGRSAAADLLRGGGRWQRRSSYPTRPRRRRSPPT